MSKKDEKDEIVLAAEAAKLLIDRKLSVTAAESCTGGMLAALLVNEAGISEVFEGSVVTYSNRLKVKYAGVQPDTLERYGAVSEQTAFEMADGIRKNVGADIGLSATGVAGPGGGTAEKPVGLVYIGYSDCRGAKTKRLNLSGDRESIRKATCREILIMLCENAREIQIK